MVEFSCLSADFIEKKTWTFCCFCQNQDSEVFIQEKRSGQQETLWNPTPDIRSRRLKRQVVRLDQQGEFESER